MMKKPLCSWTLFIDDKSSSLISGGTHDTLLDPTPSFHTGMGIIFIYMLFTSVFEKFVNSKLYSPETPSWRM